MYNQTSVKSSMLSLLNQHLYFYVHYKKLKVKSLKSYNQCLWLGGSYLIISGYFTELKELFYPGIC